jgi:hypothetical protein
VSSTSTLAVLRSSFLLFRFFYYKWSYQNNYDGTQGTADVELIKIYKPQGVAFVCTIITENLAGTAPGQTHQVVATVLETGHSSSPKKRLIPII